MTLDLINILGATSIILSTYSMYFLGMMISDDVEARKDAKARYEKDPELELLAEDFYVPTVTVGTVLMFTFLWIMPGINLVSGVSSLVFWAYTSIKKVWHNPVIDW